MVGPPVDETADASSFWCTLDAGQRDQVWQSLARRPQLWERLPELEPGIVARLGRLTRQRGWDVVFLTSRPTNDVGATVQVQSQRWLAARGFDLPAVVVCSGSRGPLAAFLRRDVVVDDRSRSCLEVATESTARAVLIWRPGRGTPPASLASFGVSVAPSMNDCLDFLVAADCRPSSSRTHGRTRR
jgi:hypothetical protein